MRLRGGRRVASRRHRALTPVAQASACETLAASPLSGWLHFVRTDILTVAIMAIHYPLHADRAESEIFLCIHFGAAMAERFDTLHNIGNRLILLRFLGFHGASIWGR